MALSSLDSITFIIQEVQLCRDTDLNFEIKKFQDSVSIHFDHNKKYFLEIKKITKSFFSLWKKER